MTLSTVVSGNVQKQWDEKFYREYIRANRFARYQGTDANSIIQLKEQLTKKPGDAITLSLVKALSGAGVTGNTLLEGAEESVSNYAHQISIGAYRNGVAMTEWEEQKSPIVALDTVRPLLKDWAMELNRTKVIAALSAVIPDSGVQEPYATATSTERDEFIVSNSDRVLFGALKSNAVSGVFATALATLDATDDKFTYSKVSLMKRIAKTADPIIRPVRVNDDEEWYVAFCGSNCFRDLKTSLATIHADAMQRGRDNPLFTDGDLVYDGVIIREVPEIAALAANVGEVFLCGAQAVGHVIGKRWSSNTESRDYGFVTGAAIAGFFGTEKLVFNGKQHGVVTGYMYAAADA
jgi:N4-gp56 family major capsid protein